MPDRNAESNFPGSAFRDLRDAEPRPDEEPTQSGEDRALILYLRRYGRARNRAVDRDARTVTITDDDCLTLLRMIGDDGS